MLFFINSSSSSTITALRGNTHRNIETTPSLSSLSQINTGSQATILHTVPPQAQLPQSSVSSYPLSSDDGIRSLNLEHINRSKGSSEQQNMPISNDIHQLQEPSPNTEARCSSEVAKIPISPTPSRYDSVMNETSFTHIEGDDRQHTEGACANAHIKLNQTSIVKDEEEKIVDKSNSINHQDSNETFGFSIEDAKSLDPETDNHVAEYTTVVVGKVFSAKELNENIGTKYSQDDQTIYASIEHINSNSSQSPSMNYSLSKPFKESPSQDIQKEFEKDFCSVEEALGGNREDCQDVPLPIMGAQIIDDNTDIRDLENSESVRITINFDDDSDSQLLKYNNELASVSSQMVLSSEETDCDLLANDDGDLDVQTLTQTSDPPNRTITIVGSEPLETISSNESNQNVQSINSNEGQSAITLEIDTSTSVI